MNKNFINAIAFCLLLICIISLAIKLNFKPEDVNRDGKVDAKDLLEVQKYIIGSDR